MYDHLVSHFGKGNVFMDVDNIEPGLDFVDVLQQTISSCDAMVAVIGRQWLTATDSEGRRRLDNPDDLVRVEIATALDRKIRVIPTLVAGAPMPRSQDLPEAIASLARRNALEISDVSFQLTVGPLIQALENTLNQVRNTAGPRPGAAAEAPRPQPAQNPTATFAAQPPAPDQLRSAGASAAAAPARWATEPVPQYPPPARDASLVLAGMPRWRRYSLFYPASSVAGWIFRAFYWLFAFYCFIGVIAGFGGSFAESSAWAGLGVLVVVTELLRRGALWSDRKADRNRGIRTR